MMVVVVYVVVIVGGATLEPFGVNHPVVHQGLWWLLSSIGN